MKTIFFALVTLSLMTACGKDGSNGGSGLNGTPGTPGSPGSPGNNGSNGHNLIYKIIQSAPSCQYDGITIVMATDMNDNGLIDGTDTNIQTAVVCNGKP